MLREAVLVLVAEVDVVGLPAVLTLLVGSRRCGFASVLASLVGRSRRCGFAAVLTLLGRKESPSWIRLGSGFAGAEGVAVAAAPVKHGEAFC